MPIVQNNTEYTTKSNTDYTTQSSNTKNSSYNVDETLYQPPRFSLNHSRPNEENPAVPECQLSNERDIPGCPETRDPDILVFPDP